MVRSFILVAALIATSATAFASSTRTLDGAQITNGAATLTLPTTTDTIIGRATTDTLTNKTLTSPAITTPTGIVKGDVGLGNVDNTSDATKNSASVTLTNKTISGSSNTLTVLAGSQLSGQVPVANGGTGASTLTSGSVVVGNGTSAVSLVAPGTSGNVLTSNGSTWTSSAPAATAPGVQGSAASPVSVTAAGGISFSGTAYENYAFVTGSPGAVTVSASPQIAAATNIGQRLVVFGGANTVTLADGTGLSLNGSWVGGTNSALVLVWNGTVWAEASRR
jgi:hypothetical protein